MNIWIDLTNSPHINFFAAQISELQKKHSVILTCRPLANTIGLLQLRGFAHHVVGRHYGQQKTRKLSGFPIRIGQLCRFLKSRHIDLAVSHSSFYSPVVARLLGIPSIYLNDNEHADGNRISFLFADKILVPEFLDPAKVIRQWARPEKIIVYPGVKEGIYLWHYLPSGFDDLPPQKTEGKKTIFIRPEPWTAQYYKGERNFMDDFLLELRDHYHLVVLPRGNVQEAYYRQAKFAGIHVPERSIALEEIMANCDLFIGAGGTMTREAAVLGVPTISIYQDELLDVDRFLIARGAMVHNKHPDAAFIRHFLQDHGKRDADPELLRKGKEAYDLIMATILSYARG